MMRTFGVGPRKLAASLAILAGLAMAAEASACSGSGAIPRMRRSSEIGLTYGIVALAFLVAALPTLLGRSQAWRVLALGAMACVQPTWWMGVSSGDCGYLLRSTSFFFAAGTAAAVALLVAWPRRKSPSSRSTPRAAPLIGLGIGLGLGVAFFAPRQSIDFDGIVLLGALAASGWIGGGWAGRIVRPGDLSRRKFGIGSLLLLPIVIGPPILALFPVLPFRTTALIGWRSNVKIVDAQTGRPIADAMLRIFESKTGLINSLSTSNGSGMADGHLTSKIRGRSGLLGQSRIFDGYAPMSLDIMAEGYEIYRGSIEDGPATPGDDRNAPTIHLAAPPPPMIEVRLTPSR